MIKGFIDTHAHPPTKEWLVITGGKFLEAAEQLFGGFVEQKSIEDMIIEYEEAGVEKIILVAWDAETATGLPKLPNDYIAKLVDQHPDRIIGFASVDPHKGRSAIKELDRSLRELTLQGLKLHPQAQAFFPNDRQYYPIYEKCLEYNVPITFHTGTTGWGSGLPGGGGTKLKFANPIYLDDVAADFPELKIIASHPSFPWQDEQLAIVRHKKNVYLELSGWLPKYFQPTLITYMSKLITDKCLFGTDYPYIKPARWLKEFDALNPSPIVREKILRENAVKLLGL